MGRRRKQKLKQRPVVFFSERINAPKSSLRQLWRQVKGICLGQILDKIKKSRFLQATLVVSGLMFGFIKFAYPIYIDYYDGKWGGQIILKLSEEALNENAPTYFFYAVPKDTGDARYLVPITLSVHNTHKVHDMDVTLSIRYDKANQRKFIREEFMTHSGSRSATELSHEVNSKGQYDYVNHQIKFLPADDSFSFSEGAISSSIGFDREIPPLIASGAGLNIQATTFSEKDVRRKWDIRYRGIRVENKPEVERYLKNWYAKYIVLETRKNNNFWGYFFGLFFSRDVVAYGFLPNFGFLPGLNLYLPKDDPENYIGIKFNPYVWSLLFDFPATSTRHDSPTRQ